MQRTRELLHGALGALIREKPYDAIAVREILSRANVGRSTFYTHFRDKDELLASGIHDLVGATDASDILRFSRPMFEHIDQHRREGDGQMGARGRALLHERMRRVVARQINDALAAAGRAQAEPIPRELIVRHVTTTFIVVLDWWVSSRSRLSAAHVDAVFRRLVGPALTGS